MVLQFQRDPPRLCCLVYGDHRRQMAAQNVHTCCVTWCVRAYFLCGIRNCDPDMMFWGDVSQCDGVYAHYCVTEQRLLFLFLTQAGRDPVTAFPPIRGFLVRWVHCRHVGSKLAGIWN